MTELLPTTNMSTDYIKYPLYVRKSHIESYSFCPYQFKLQYVDELEIKESYAMTVGTRFHEFADKFFDICESYNTDQWYDFIPSSFGNYERSMAEFFIDYEINDVLIEENPMWFPAFRELELFHDDLLISGGIDRIDWVVPGKTVKLWEYKTSKKFDKKSLSRQFGIYKLLIEDILGYEVVECVDLNPRLRTVTPVVPMNRIAVLELVDMIRYAYYNPETCKPKCSDVKYFICCVCRSMEEANLYTDVAINTL